MEIYHWINTHGFDLLEAVGIIASLTFTAVGFHRDDRSRRIENLLTLTDSHRAVWKEMLHEPKLGRILNPAANLTQKPVSNEEEIFVTLVIQHLSITFQALRSGMLVNLEGLSRDVAEFFTLPIPLEVWNRVRALQNARFQTFVEACRNWKKSDST